MVGHGPGHDPCRSAKGRNSGGWDNVKTWESTSLWSGLVWCGVVQPGRGERLQLGPPEPALTVNGSNGGAHWATFQLSLMKCRKMIVSLLPLMQCGNAFARCWSTKKCLVFCVVVDIVSLMELQHVYGHSTKTVLRLSTGMHR